MSPGHFLILYLIVAKSRSKGAEKTVHDDFVQLCIHLTANSQAVYSCFAPVDQYATIVRSADVNPKNAYKE